MQIHTVWKKSPASFNYKSSNASCDPSLSTWKQGPYLPHLPEDLLVRLVWVLVIGHYAWLKVCVSSSISWISVALSPTQKPPAIAQLISTGVLRVSLGPGHHQKAQTASKRQPQDKG